MKKIKAALFDLDGTLVDTEGQYTEFWGTTGKRFCPDNPRFALEIKGTTLFQIYDRYFPNPEVQREISLILNEFEAQMQFPIIAGAREFVEDLKAHGVKCAIVTSSNQEKLANVWAKEGEFLRLFDRVLTAEDFSASKPNPDCYLRGAEVFGVTPDECVVFEDAFTGLQAGMTAGMFTFGLTTGNPAEAIRDKCNFVMPDFRGCDYDWLCSVVR